MQTLTCRTIAFTRKNAQIRAASMDSPLRLGYVFQRFKTQFTGPRSVPELSQAMITMIPDCNSWHAYGKNNLIAGAFPANRTKTNSDIPVAELVSAASAGRILRILSTIAIGWVVIIAAAPPNIQRQHAIVEIDRLLTRSDWNCRAPC